MREDWESKELKEFSKIMYGHTAKASDETDGPKYLRITDIQNHSVDWKNVPNCPTPEDDSKYKLSSGDIVFARTGATTGKSFLIKNPPEAVFASYLIRVQSQINDVLPDFLYKYFQSSKYWNKIEAGISGSAQGGFNATKLGKLKIPIPPLPEQKRIVEILDEAFEAIDQAKANVERNIQNAEELFQSKLNDIFSQRRDGWEEKSLKEICEIRPSKRQVKNKMSDNELVSFVPMSHLEINKKYFKEESIKPLGEVYKGYTYFEDGDVLLAKITPCFENGKLGIATNLENGVGFGSTEYIIYRPYDGLLNEYLYYFLNRDTFRKLGESLMGGAVGHQRIQKEFYEDFSIAYPEVPKQKDIVKELDAISSEKVELVSVFKKKLSSLEELKKSILQKAFSGELTAGEQVAA